MAQSLAHGKLKGFGRARIGLKPPSNDYSDTGKLWHASIHHGGPVGAPRMTFRAAAKTWRDWQAYHLSQGWIDIGYNIGVDGKGRLYKGRPVGALPAAVGYHNTGSVGINFMQDGRFYGLTTAQRRTLKILFEIGVPEWNLPPLKKLQVYAHREYSGHTSNECPGDKIHRHLRWRRNRY
jgi:hypothetical protein